MQETPIKHEALRWIAMPFAATLGATLGCFLIVGLHWLWLRFFQGYSETGACFLYILSIASSVVYGWLFTLIASEVAPRGKFIACVVMVTVQGVLFTMVGIMYCMSFLTTGSKVWECLLLAVAVGSSIASLVNNNTAGRSYAGR